MSNTPLTVYARLSGDFLCDGALWETLGGIAKYRTKYFPNKPVVVADCPEINDEYFTGLLNARKIGYQDENYDSI